MPRISGVDIPGDKPTYISLTYLYGIGQTTAIRICRSLGVDLQRTAKELSDDDLARIANLLDKEYTIDDSKSRFGFSRTESVAPVNVIDDHVPRTTSL